MSFVANKKPYFVNEPHVQNQWSQNNGTDPVYTEATKRTQSKA